MSEILMKKPSGHPQTKMSYHLSWTEKDHFYPAQPFAWPCIINMGQRTQKIPQYKNTSEPRSKHQAKQNKLTEQINSFETERQQTTKLMVIQWLTLTHSLYTLYLHTKYIQQNPLETSKLLLPNIPHHP